MILDFGKQINFQKIDIDMGYVYDVNIWVKTDWVKDLKGNIWNLRNIVATQREEYGDIDILLNVATDEDACDPSIEKLSLFDNSEEIRQEVLTYIQDNIEQIKYTKVDRRM